MLGPTPLRRSRPDRSDDDGRSRRGCCAARSHSVDSTAVPGTGGCSGGAATLWFRRRAARRCLADLTGEEPMDWKRFDGLVVRSDRCTSTSSSRTPQGTHQSPQLRPAAARSSGCRCRSSGPSSPRAATTTMTARSSGSATGTTTRRAGTIRCDRHHRRRAGRRLDQDRLPGPGRAARSRSTCRTSARTGSIAQCFEFLATLGDDGELAPGLAESWEPNEDGTVWTFQLRHG